VDVATVTDDLGASLPGAGPRRRVVSLVPSLTEAVAATRREALIGATSYCTHPPDLDVPRVRGTKNPDVAAVVALRPDLVIANKEENRRRDVERLRAAGVPVWVTDIETVEQALRSLRRLFTLALGWPVPAWLAAVEREWVDPVPVAVLRAAVPIWRDPWMAVGSRTFTGDLLHCLGIGNVLADSPHRYPHVSVDELVQLRPEVVLLPDEPYPFSAHDGPEAFPGLRCALVEGRALTWYGPSLLTARDVLAVALAT
jgi:ABC-type Fe3+-hydroxamate transport system substrate-binding protein